MDVPSAKRLVSSAASPDWNKNRRFFQIGEKNQCVSMPGIAPYASSWRSKKRKTLQLASTWDDSKKSFHKILFFLSLKFWKTTISWSASLEKIYCWVSEKNNPTPTNRSKLIAANDSIDSWSIPASDRTSNKSSKSKEPNSLVPTRERTSDGVIEASNRDEIS